MSTPEKRPAFEPAERLLAPTRSDPGMRRPVTTVAGALLVLLRVAIGVFWMVELARHSTRIAAEADASLDGVSLGPDVVFLGLAVVLAIAGAVLLVEALFAVLIYRGRNFPRVVVMVFAVLSISGSFTAWWWQGQEFTLHNTGLPTLALDILVLLALSSRSAAAYARRNEPAPEA